MAASLSVAPHHHYFRSRHSGGLKATSQGPMRPVSATTIYSLHVVASLCRSWHVVQEALTAGWDFRPTSVVGSPPSSAFGREHVALAIWRTSRELRTWATCSWDLSAHRNRKCASGEAPGSTSFGGSSFDLTADGIAS